MIRRAMGILLIAMLPTAGSFAAEPVKPVSSEVEKAVLAEDWAKVLELLKDIDANSSSPVARLIKGHACLAVNKNNDSLRLFASTLNAESRDQWQQWADRFAERHKTNAIALYLQGDAFARRSVWSSASQVLDRALKLKPDFHLALNAHGVVAHAVGNTIMARSYFVKATQARSDYADGLTSRGTLNIHMGLDGAAAYFEKAKELSKDGDPALVLIGLGSSNYGKQEYEKAEHYFQQIPEESVTYSLARRNLVENELARLRQLIYHSERVGTSIRSFRLNSNRGVGSGDPDEIGPDVKIVSIEVAPDGTAYIRLSDGRLVIIPPSGEQATDGPPLKAAQELLRSLTGDQTMGNRDTHQSEAEAWREAIVRAYRLLEELRAQYASMCTGSAGSSAACQALKKRIEELEEAIANIGRGQPSDLVSLDRQTRDAVFRDVRLAVTQMELQTTSVRPTLGGSVQSPRPGGADSNPTAARSNRGKWGVSTVYGLLYAVQEPPETILSLTRARKGQ